MKIVKMVPFLLFCGFSAVCYVRMKKGKMETKRKTIHDVPIDEILSRLPAKFVWSLRSVCKKWQSVIEAPSFAYQHLRRSKNLCLMVSSNEKDRDKTRFYSVDQDGRGTRSVPEVFDHPTKTVSSTDGLICYLGNDLHIKVCNPVTGELITLPKPTFLLSDSFKYDPYFHMIEIGMGFDSIRRKYKVIAFMALIGTTDLPEVEICTLGESNGWRKVQVPSSAKVEEWQQRVYANGCVFWTTSEYYKPHGDRDMSRALMAFNFAEEQFKFVPLPSDTVTLNDSRSVFEVDGCLCLMELIDGNMKFVDVGRTPSYHVPLCFVVQRDQKVKLRMLTKSSEWVYQQIGLPSEEFYCSACPLSSGVLLVESYEFVMDKHILHYNERGEIVKRLKLCKIPRSMAPIQLHSESVVSLRSILAAEHSN